MPSILSNENINGLKPALFLDRDGVINKDYGYVHSVDNFEFLPGIFELVRKAKKKGYLCIIVTNQAGIGRGIFSLEQFYHLSEWMCKQFQAAGGLIDAIYYSPFHPTEAKGQYLRDENTRKPGCGMFLEAINNHSIDLDKSIMVGDRESDMLAGLSANVAKNYLFSSSGNYNFDKPINSEIVRIKNLSEIEL